MNNKEKKIILGVGHPRTGTRYTSQLISEWGLNIGHEGRGIDGIIAWQFAVKDNQTPIYAFVEKDLYREQYDYEVTVYNVRNPINSLPSIIYTENGDIPYDNNSVKYRKRFIKIDDGNILAKGIQSLVEWDKLILKNDIDIIFRVEDQQKYLYDKLSEKISKKIHYNEKSLIPKNTNNRKHKNWEELENLISDTPKNLLIELNDYCERYGYKKIFDIKNHKLIK